MMRGALDEGRLQLHTMLGGTPVAGATARFVHDAPAALERPLDCGDRVRPLCCGVRGVAVMFALYVANAADHPSLGVTGSRG